MANSNKNSKGSGDSNLRRDMGIIGLLFAAIGSIIGSGWLFGALRAAEIAGPASIIAWALGGIMILFIAINYAELGTMFPVSGGPVRYPHYAFGSFTSYSIGWITWLAAASTTAIEVLAVLQYANNYLPWLEHLVNGTPTLSGPGFGVGVALLAIFSLVNVVGIRWFARLNNVLVWWKIGIVVLVIIAFGVTVFHGAHLTDQSAGGFFPDGWGGVLSAIASAGVVFSFLGFRQAVNLAGETDNPQKYVPIALIVSVIVTAILYIGLQVTFIGALPTNALVNGWANIGTSFASELTGVKAAFGPLAAIATFIGLTWLAVILYIDAVISPGDTSLIYTAVTSRISFGMGRNGNAPSSLAKVNEQGVPWVSVILTFIVGCIFFLPFPSWNKIVGFVTGATVLSFGSGPLAMLAMRMQIPEHERPFRLPFYRILAFLGFLSSNLIVYWSGWFKVWEIMAAVGIGYIVLIINEIVNKHKTPALEFRSGYWVLIWFGGLTLLSWLGTYSGTENGGNAGNLGVIPVGWDVLVFAVFSVIITWLALKSRLPAEKVKAHVAEQIEEEKDSPLDEGM
jgi:amino acid transporter